MNFTDWLNAYDFLDFPISIIDYGTDKIIYKNASFTKFLSVDIKESTDTYEIWSRFYKNDVTEEMKHHACVFHQKELQTMRTLSQLIYIMEQKLILNMHFPNEKLLELFKIEKHCENPWMTESGKEEELDVYNSSTARSFLDYHICKIKEGNAFTIAHLKISTSSSLNKHVLQTVVATIQSSIRKTDFLALLHSDEFLLAFPGADTKVVEYIISIIIEKLTIIAFEQNIESKFGIYEVGKNDNADSAIKKSQQHVFIP